MHRALLIVLLLSQLACGHAPAPAEDPATPGFSLSDISGTLHVWSEFRGRPVVLTFFSSWCFACAPEMRGLEELQEYFHGTIAILTIGTYDRRENLARFANEQRLSFPILVDEDGRVANSFGVGHSLPVTMVFDSAGNPVSFPDPQSGEQKTVITGPRGWNSAVVVRNLEALLKKR